MLPQFSRTHTKIVATGIAACLALIAGCSSESDSTLPSSTSNASSGSQTTTPGPASTGTSISTSPIATANTKISTTSAAPRLHSKPATSPVTSPAAGPVPTWTPPSLSPAQLADDEDGRKLGHKIEYRDPATFPKPLKNVTKPAIPPEIYKRTEKGAKKTVEYFADSLQYLLATKNETPLAEVTSTTCETCETYFKVSEITNQQKGYIIPEKLAITDLYASSEGEGWFEFTGTFLRPPYKRYFPSESRIEQSPDRTGTWIFKVTWSNEDQVWLMEKLGRQV